MRPTPPACLVAVRYCDFFSGSCVAEDEDGLLGEALLAPPLAEPAVLGCEALELELESLLELGDAALEPPEAEPDLVASLEPDPLMPEDELDEAPGAPGAEGDDDAPPVPPTDAEPELELGALDGDEAEPLGVAVVLELEEPGLDEVLLVSPRSHAASPNASATATARVESFMCPPWVGFKYNRRASSAPSLSP